MLAVGPAFLEKDETKKVCTDWLIDWVHAWLTKDKDNIILLLSGQ